MTIDQLAYLKERIKLVQWHHDKREEEKVKTKLFATECLRTTLDTSRLLRLGMAVEVRT